jgi:Type I restriction modification DNA specificity domain
MTTETPVSEALEIVGRDDINQLPALANGRLERMISRDQILRELAGKMEGSTGRQRLSKASLENLELSLPPLPEQRAIARALRSVQEAREERQKELLLERERKAALMQHLFTHGTCDEALKQTEIGEIPESWRVDQLREFCVSSAFGPRFSSDLSGGEKKPQLIYFIPFILILALWAVLFLVFRKRKRKK